MTGLGGAPKARIGVVDDHPSTLDGLRAALADQSDLHYAGGAASVPALLSAHPGVDLVILDLRLDDDSTPQDNIAILDAAGIPAVAFTSAEHPQLVRLAAAAGVRAVLRKNVDNSVLLDTCRAVLSGEESPSVDWAAAVDADHTFVELPEQLRRVLELLAAGQSIDEVARSMGLSRNTIKDYVGRIRRKYAAAGRPAPTPQHLVHRAIEDGWFRVPRLLRRR